MGYSEIVCPGCSCRTFYEDGCPHCYCIRCGRRILAEEAAAHGDVGDGSVSITISVPAKGRPFAVSIDGEEVLRANGGEHEVRTAPGRHTIGVRQDLFSFSQEVELSEGSRVSISVGIMGIRVSVERCGRGASAASRWTGLWSWAPCPGTPPAPTAGS